MQSLSSQGNGCNPTSRIMPRERLHFPSSRHIRVVGDLRKRKGLPFTANMRTLSSVFRAHVSFDPMRKWSYLKILAWMYERDPPLNDVSEMPSRTISPWIVFFVNVAFEKIVICYILVSFFCMREN